MYLPFNLPAKHKFIAQELAREYLAFPDEVEEAYSAVINWLSGLEGMAGFDQSRNVDLDSHEMLHTGRQFSLFLPSHTMKIYQDLLRIEAESISKGAASILNQPYISIVDNGCGGGTASIALMSLITNYQKYRLANGLPVFPIALSCLGIDPNTQALQIYGRFLRECAHRIRCLLIDVTDIEIFPGTLPVSSALVIESLAKRDRIHLVVVALANVIRPLTKERSEESAVRSIFERIGMGSLLPERWGKDIGAREISTLSSILSTNGVDQIIVLLVGAHSARNGKQDQSWRDEMAAFQKALHSKLSKSHHVKVDPIRSRVLKIVNPRDSFWRKHPSFGNKMSPEKEYDGGYVVIDNWDYVQDSDWHEILQEENLLLAWARVRNALGFEMLEDTIELRLFEANIKERLIKLRHDVLSYQWDALGVGEMLNFRVPKGLGKESRPMSLCRLEDQILATAILQAKVNEYDKAKGPRSYAHKVSKRKGEFLYENWREAHKAFLEAAREATQQNPSYQVIETDLSSYYTDIIQSELFREIERQMVLYNSRGNDLAKKLIDRDCGIGKEGCGIPQGHTVSGAMANLYLIEVDRKFGPGNQWEIEYFRFVDDMIFVFPPSIDASFILASLDEMLSDPNLGLTRSKDKTSRQPMSTQEFLERTAPDTLLEELSKEHNFVLSDLYKLDRAYVRIALDDWWAFVERYQKLLVSIGVYISVPRLSRKLQKNLRWWRRAFNWRRKLKMPEIEQLKDLEDIDRWRSEFNQYNSDWIYKRSNLWIRLRALFRDSLELLNSDSETERRSAKTRVKFSSYRLGQLGFGDEANAIVDLIVEQPWTLQVRRACHDLALQGQEDSLLNAFNRIYHLGGEEWGYIRGAILKAFSYLPSISEDSVSFLRDAVLNGKTTLEKTMASEALLLLRRVEILEKSELLKAIEQGGDSYMSKNFALLYALASGESDVLGTNLSQKRILNEALEYSRVMPELDEIYRHEPDILREEFYVGDYSDDPDEFEDFRYY